MRQKKRTGQEKQANPAGCRGRGALLPSVIFVIFALLFALLCAGGKALLRALTDGESAGAAGTAAFLSSSGRAGSVPPVLVLDAGHGGQDAGAIGTDGTLEKDVNLAVSRTLADLFRAAGVKVIETRTDDRLLCPEGGAAPGRRKIADLAERLRIGSRADCGLFLSIHQNSFPEEKYSGLQVWYSPNAAESAGIAEAIREGVRSALQPENGRETKPAGREIFLLDRLECPAVLVECGFLSNAEECAKLNDPDYRRMLALAIYAAVMQ